MEQQEEAFLARASEKVSIESPAENDREKLLLITTTKKLCFD